MSHAASNTERSTMMDETRYPEIPLLLVDDEASWLNSLSMALEYSGGIDHLLQCQDSSQVMNLLAEQEVSLILLDLTMPKLSGEELLKLIVAEYPWIPVVILSGMNQLQTAVNCMKAGAFDYYVKVGEMDRLVAGIRRALEQQRMEQKYLRLKRKFFSDGLEHPEAFAEIITDDNNLRSVFQYVEAIAPSNEPVLITGESGVGKELFARAVHLLSRPELPWVAVNVAGLDGEHFADSLFGHLPGAFTGAGKGRPGMIEEAGSGTLFLDEIGDLSLESQVKLLRLLQEGEYFPLGSDRPKRLMARIVFATNQDLAVSQQAGRFRKDLYYRLRAHLVEIPPLRERSTDIPLLLQHFITQAAERLNIAAPVPPKELPLLLANYSFPGNIRELRAMVYDAVSQARKGKISMAPFRKQIGNLSASAEKSDKPTAEGTGLLTSTLPSLAQAAKLLVSEAMQRSGGNQSIAAGLLGISRQALNRRLKNHQN